MRSEGNNDERMGSAFTGDKGRPTGVAVRAEIGVGQVRTVEHHVRREMYNDAFFVGRQAFRRQHIVDAGPCRWLEDALSEGVGNEALNFFAALPLSA